MSPIVCGPALTDIVSGQMQFMSVIFRQPLAGQDRASDAAGRDNAQTFTQSANVPTMEEAGFPGL